MEPNCKYSPQDGIGVNLCLGRPVNGEYQLYHLRGIEGFAYQSTDGKDMYEMIIDGYTARGGAFTLRTHKKNLKFFR